MTKWKMKETNYNIWEMAKTSSKGVLLNLWYYLIDFQSQKDEQFFFLAKVCTFYSNHKQLKIWTVIQSYTLHFMHLLHMTTQTHNTDMMRRWQMRRWRMIDHKLQPWSTGWRHHSLWLSVYLVGGYIWLESTLLNFPMNSKYIFVLFTVFTVKGDSVSQPKDVTGLKGRMVTLSCQFDTIGVMPYCIFWYQQKPNSFPKYMLWRNAIGEVVEHGFRGRFSTTLNTTSKTVPLIIQNLQVSDSAVYYCSLSSTVTAAHWALTQKPLGLLTQRLLTPCMQILACSLRVPYMAFSGNH